MRDASMANFYLEGEESISNQMCKKRSCLVLQLTAADLNCGRWAPMADLEGPSS